MNNYDFLLSGSNVLSWLCTEVLQTLQKHIITLNCMVEYRLTKCGDDRKKSDD